MTKVRKTNDDVFIYFFITSYFIKKTRLCYPVFPAHFLCSAYYVFASFSFAIYRTFVLFNFFPRVREFFKIMRTLVSIVSDGFSSFVSQYLFDKCNSF